MTDNSKHLIEHKRAESAQKAEAVKEAIRYMLYSSEVITLNKVARKANVSRTFIYSNAELREVIESSKAPSVIKAEKKRITSGLARSEESKVEIIRTLKARIKNLVSEIEGLKQDNMKLRSYIESIEG